MNKIFRVSLTIFAPCVLMGTVFSYTTTHAATVVFTKTLKVGTSGEDVRGLQRILNLDPETMVQEGGPGSPGQETAYFGSLTRAAVIRFQEKYKDDILVPNGLISGTGFVGPSTLAFLNKLSQELDSALTIQKVSPNQNNTVGTTALDSSAENPNRRNLNAFLAGVESLAQKRGIPSDKIARIKNRITIDVATSTDLQKKFIEVVQKSISQKIPSPMRNALAEFIRPLVLSFLTKHARADVGLPFGGEILYSYYCSCSQNWLIYILPAISPTMPTMLSYETGSQAYLNYNLPFALLILGDYEPGVGYCISEPEADCGVDIPSEGLITPLVGSL